jgi:hypothetical protein
MNNHLKKDIPRVKTKLFGKELNEFLLELFNEANEKDIEAAQQAFKDIEDDYLKEKTSQY